MNIGVGVDSCICFCCLDFFPHLFSVSFLVFSLKWPRVLLTGKFSDPVWCLSWGFWGLRSPDLVWHLVKLLGIWARGCTKACVLWIRFWGVGLLSCESGHLAVLQTGVDCT